ncbi:hypothetical protein ACFVG1_14300 [Streptomyces bacillaris]|uniref:hypothetical protein n=1 Tax=Streptomyces TaxID=1883 RepID=UPI0012FF5252|nr:MULTISPECIES: hypothetical protein [unclassified Streptomyces]MYT92989.1 hypothetical protein [Streptomyces sp. SID8359]
MNDPMDYPGIKSWAEEWGGRVDYLDYVKDHGNLGMMVAFSRIFWPRFVEVDGCVLWDRAYEESNFKAWSESLSGDVRKIEATLNQLRVWQMVDSDDVEEDWQAQDFFAACVAKTWGAALAAEFPRRIFDVRVIGSEDGPIVTFSSGLV